MRYTIADIREMKARKEKVLMITAYDYATARLVEEAGMHMILVGDSLGMVVLGYESTIPVTMDEMIHHTRAVTRATKKCLVVGDMPFMTYTVSVEDALRNAARFIREGGCQSVKLEGGEMVAETVRRIVNCGIPVCGHIGLTPQSVNQMGGYKIQGKTPEAAAKLLNDAVCLEQAGAFAVVLECVPSELAKLISRCIAIPTVGIGAGLDCDGQVQVVSDVLGFYELAPKHAKKYANLAETIKKAVADYAAEVKAGTFPTAKQSYSMDAKLLEGL
ncbi:MAG: 3-methyl-2-oxobutanoate hydroxymethyltransferase [Chloroflexota bacterium]